MSRILVALLASLILTTSAHAATVTVKLATLAPEGSTWHKALRKLADEWKVISNGEVEMKIYAGGVVGNETVMLRKMRIGQLHAGAVTNLGLVEIDPSSQVLNTPMLIRNYDELDYVMSKERPGWETRIEEKGYRVIGWSDAGWAYMFSKAAIAAPADRGSLKMFAWEGDPAVVKLYQNAGFKPVVLAATDVLPSLQSGLIDAFPTTPLGALALQWFGLAPNMLDVPWAPLLGATIITEDAWNLIPAKYHEALMASSRAQHLAIQEDIRRQDKKAISVMQKYGLTVHAVTPEQFAQWEQIGEGTHAFIRTEMVPPAVFDRVKGYIDEHRAAHP